MTVQSGLHLGIDTGGTFTDGVLLNPLTREVVKTAKVLTTHYDLSICIAGILEKLTADAPESIALVSLSTTLATNAIAEGKRKSVALLLLGYDPELVRQYQFQHQFGTPHYHFIQGKHGLDGSEEIPLDETHLCQVVESMQDKVEAFAISSYAASRNADHELRAGELVASRTEAPVVQSHHLSSQLDSIRRATTASLNASLLSNAQDFLNAVEEMLVKKGIRCPVMMVRGDGSIVRASYARQRPVEIIHSGPATSAAGGQFLAGIDTALVIDVGGTTTDIALIENGKTQVEQNAATVGHYRTCVKTIKVRSFGLGGDSLIRFDRARSLSVGPDRVLPFSHLCCDYPEAKRELVAWLKEKKEIQYYDRMEVWILRREPVYPIKDPRTQMAIELLREGPKILPKLLKAVGVKSPVQLNASALVNQEIIERVGLTPTDILHVTGEFAPWDVEIAHMIIDMIAQSWEMSSEDLIQKIRQLITKKIAGEIIQFLSAKKLTDPSLYSARSDDLDRWLFDESMEARDSHLGCQIVLKDPIVGIGAPAKAFLTDVARSFSTEIILPDHYEVANAVGTVVGNIMVLQEGEVSPVVEGTVVTGFTARLSGEVRSFDDFGEAREYARCQLTKLAAEEAVSAGAVNPVIEYSETEVIPGLMVQLSAWAIDKPGLNGNLPIKS